MTEAYGAAFEELVFCGESLKFSATRWIGRGGGRVTRGNRLPAAEELTTDNERFAQRNRDFAKDNSLASAAKFLT
jgi:hypothetical protein